MMARATGARAGDAMNGTNEGSGSVERAARPTSAERGVAAVEMALVLPLLMMLLLGIIDWGWVFYQEFNLASAVRQGARVGVTVPPSAAPDPPTTAKATATAALAALGVDVSGATITSAYGGAAPMTTLTVAVKLPYKPIIGFVPTPKSLSYSMTMMMEQQN